MKRIDYAIDKLRNDEKLLKEFMDNNCPSRFGLHEDCDEPYCVEEDCIDCWNKEAQEL